MNAFHRHIRRDESGFTLLEVLVVMVILLILLGATIFTYQGARESSKNQMLLMAATAYSKSIDAYRIDNGGRVPTGAGPAWPAADIGYGPLDILANPPRKYLRGGLPEGVGTLIRFNALGTGIGPTASQYIVTYQATGPSAYVITAQNLKSGYSCTVTNQGTGTC